MICALYSPYILTNEGGGERYLLTIAEHLSQNRNASVHVIAAKALDAEREKRLEYLAQKYGLNLNKVQLVSVPFFRQDSLRRYLFTRSYDAFLLFTDGSLFLAGSKRNILHIQIPLKIGPTGLKNWLKLKTWHVKVANSYFTKAQVEKNWRVNIDYVHWGAVDPRDFKPLKKENIIIHVGRFFTGLHCKRQDVIVDVFKKIVDRGTKNWRLVLIGPIDPGEDNAQYTQRVKEIAKDYPVSILHSISFDKLKHYYGVAKIYWHATGFDLDEDEYPEKMEHLGLSTVEAMSAGAVPIVIKKGGQKEIVTHEKNGLLWETKAELIDQTLQAMKNPRWLQQLSVSAQERAQDFSKENFQRATDTIFGLD